MSTTLQTLVPDTVAIPDALGLRLQFDAWKLTLMQAIGQQFDRVVGEAPRRSVRISGDGAGVPKNAHFLNRYWSFFRAGPENGSDAASVEDFTLYELVQILHALETNTYVPAYPCK